jgi:hypothetical protein
VICPHCHRNVKRKERTGRQCGSCHRGFALEPKDNALNLHDVRMKRLATHLGNNGGYRYTTTQLWYAAGRRSLARAGRFPVGGFVFALIAVPVLGVLGGLLDAPFLWALAAVLALGWVIYLTVRIARRHSRRLEPAIGHRDFVHRILDEWRRTYGGDVPGVVREDGIRPDEPMPRPVLVVLSHSHAALVALYVNDVHRRHNVALAFRPDQVPAGVPVVLLHDVSVDGYRFAADVRASLGPRVVADLTPRPSAAKAAKGAVKLRQPAPRPELIGWLRASGLLADADVEWLAKGWWSPIAALRPSALVGRVAAAVQRSGDPDRRKAAAVGFLTWPGDGRTG